MHWYRIHEMMSTDMARWLYLLRFLELAHIQGKLGVLWRKTRMCRTRLGPRSQRNWMKDRLVFCLEGFPCAHVVCIDLLIYAYIYLYIYVYCIHIYVYVYVYIYIFIKYFLHMPNHPGVDPGVDKIWTCPNLLMKMGIALKNPYFILVGYVYETHTHTHIYIYTHNVM